MPLFWPVIVQAKMISKNNQHRLMRSFICICRAIGFPGMACMAGATWFGEGAAIQKRFEKQKGDGKKREKVPDFASRISHTWISIHILGYFQCFHAWHRLQRLQYCHWFLLTDYDRLPQSIRSEIQRTPCNPESILRVCLWNCWSWLP